MVEVEKTRLMELPRSKLPLVATLHECAFPGYLNTQLGVKYLCEFFRWFSHASNGIALTVSEEGRPLGYVIGAPIGYERELTHQLLPRALAALLLRPRLLLDSRFRAVAMARMSLLVSSEKRANELYLPHPIFSLVGIAVHPVAQGKGIGKLLMAAFENRARAKGARSLRLSVYSENLAARKLYENTGWEHYPRNGSLADYYFKLFETSQTHAG